MEEEIQYDPSILYRLGLIEAIQERHQCALSCSRVSLYIEDFAGGGSRLEIDEGGVCEDPGTCVW